MKKLILLGCLFLNGCFYQTVNSWDIERAIAECGSLEKIAEIKAEFSGSERIICKSDNMLKLL